MTAGRKWMVAVVVGLVGVLALYYGVISGPSEEPVIESDGAGDASALAPDPTLAMRETSLPPRDPVIDRSPAGNNGFLSDSVEKVASAPPTDTAGAPFNIVGPDGAMQPVTIAHDPSDSLVRDLSKSNARPVISPDPGKGDVVLPQANQPAIVDPVKPNTPATTPGATPAVAPTNLPPKFETYVVKEGDTMSSIAATWFGDGRKWELIAKANPLVDPTKMQVGQKLNLPPKDAQREKPKLAAGSREYVVRSGDTLVSIARALYGDGAHWKKIYEANKSAIGSNPDNIREGVKLTIPQLASRSS